MTTIKLTRISTNAIISFVTAFILLLGVLSCTTQTPDKLKEAFKNPPDSSKPGVYWYFMDGNQDKGGGPP